MLEKFRMLAQTWVAKVLLALITIPFALFGVEYYFRQAGGSADTVAKVGSVSITQAEFNDNLRDQLERMREGLGGARVDTSLLDTPQLRYETLQGLINRHLLAAYADKQHLSVSDAYLAHEIAQFDAFQENGKFSQARYESLLRERGLTPAVFESRVRDDLKIQLEQEALTGSQWVPAVSIDAFLKLNDQTRELALVEIPVERFLAQVHVDDAQVKQYYDSHQEQFKVPERIKVQYLVLSADQLAQGEAVSPADIAKAYADPSNQARWQGKETRRARHILIAAPASAGKAKRDAAKAEAEKILAEAQAHPDRFAALAKQYSQDPGSAANGGDLGYFGRGMMTQPFENAVFSMKPGEIRGPIETEFGYHIIELTDVKAGKGKTLAEATPQIAEELRRQRASKQFSDEAETFSNLVYEQSGDLKPAADKLKLPIHSSDWIVRGAPLQDPVLGNPKLQNAMFALESVKDGRNTPAIEVAPNTLVSAHVVAHEPSVIRPLADVQASIVQTLQREAAARLARQDGEAQLAALQAGKADNLPWSKARQFTRQQALSERLPANVVTAAFAANPSHLPAYAGAALPTGTYALLRVSQVKEGNAGDAAKRKQAEVGLTRAYGDAVLTAFLAGLRQEATVRLLNKSVLEPRQDR
ncbi:MAG: SurA N-terminal domain-containing protein [Betaproteobacteria bacterium]|nr:SurA N-terminal domain-containing protein [Betaproteobacteria bacterium]